MIIDNLKIVEYLFKFMNHRAPWNIYQFFN